jgi:hypothetical protein
LSARQVGSKKLEEMKKAVLPRKAAAKSGHGKDVAEDK